MQITYYLFSHLFIVLFGLNNAINLFVVILWVHFDIKVTKVMYIQ
jgi:hypothetical protein